MPLPHYAGGPAFTSVKELIYIGRTRYTNVYCIRENDEYTLNFIDEKIHSIKVVKIDTETLVNLEVVHWIIMDNVYYIQTRQFDDTLAFANKGKVRELRIDEIFD